ncbi:TetR/AcrR family transcriptional regulator [Solimonas variicoloris]|uniref:TetR/AcrR family transcriptional regulator n=1 Tax=Solimonas variicoloris TaxID=254408 RepID=UPI000363D1DB|nr:TetR/AcrR family transcriptional regulator [Solimonas variicoloris]
MSTRSRPPPHPETRPRRGAPTETRARLVAAAAECFNVHGYYGVDAGEIARHAGYATGTFYKHFKDKREILLAAWDFWITGEWDVISAEAQAPGSPTEVARRVLKSALKLHVRWYGLRASLLGLVPADEGVKDFYRNLQRRQLAIIAALRQRLGRGRTARESDAMLLLTVERVFDAIAQGELRDLKLREREMLAQLTALLADFIGSPDPGAAP